MSIGKNLKRLRVNKGWTQGDLSEKTGIKVAHISKLENDEGDPKLSTIQKLINALECKADELLFNKSASGTSAILSNYINRAFYLPAKDKALLIEIIEKMLLADTLRDVDKERVPLDIWEELEREKFMCDKLFSEMVEEEHKKDIKEKNNDVDMPATNKRAIESLQTKVRFEDMDD